MEGAERKQGEGLLALRLLQQDPALSEAHLIRLLQLYLAADEASHQALMSILGNCPQRALKALHQAAVQPRYYLNTDARTMLLASICGIGRSVPDMWKVLGVGVIN